MNAGTVIWFTGLPQSGKSTLARRLERHLKRKGLAVVRLDGDELRPWLAPSRGYDTRARRGFYLALARLAAKLAREGLNVLVPATANLRGYRATARKLAPRFLEVYVATPLSDCRRRDTKGLYAAARAGKIRQLPGVGSRFDVPRSPEVTARGGHDQAAVGAITASLETRRRR